MGLEKLSIFSKDTDATEALKGYEYQKLRALENWLDNYLAKNNEVIYCDYEEDIFQRDLDQWSSKFTQLKLYSSKNFSFTSVEVTKAISHFFMLFIKGEYKFDGVQFIFETNVAIAKKYGDNEAELLQNWKDNQDNLDDTLLKQCATKVKEIILEYALKAAKGVKDKSILTQIEEAKIILEDVSDEVWTDFAKTIKWIFSDITSEEAMENVISRINDKISKTNIPAANERKESVFARLYYAVSEKSVQVESEDRKLDNTLLDSLLLDTGSEEDKGYNEDYQIWSKVTEIKYFRAAEFHKVVNLSYYCRYAPYLEHHAKTWIDLLQKYIDFPEIPAHYKQKAIYELIWANLRAKKLDVPDGTLIGYEDYIRDYISQFQNFSDYESLEDTAAMIGIVQGSAAFKRVDIPIEEIESWRNQLIDKLNGEIAIAKDPNQTCYLHAISAMLKLHNALDPTNPSNMDDAFVHFDSILSLLDKAEQYNVYQLTTRISEYIKVLIHLNHEIEHIERLEEFSDKLMPYAAKKSSDHDMAKIYVERGIKYLHSTEGVSVLRALNYFHKAKALWRHDQTKDGYILALLNISQLYTLIGNNLAAKYYALSAARHATTQTELHHRVSDAFGLILHADFKQGAWISCLEDFRFYMSSRAEFKTTQFDTEDELLMKSLSEISMVLAISPRISPQLNGLMNYEKSKMSVIYDNLIGDYIDETNRTIADTNLPTVLQNKLDDSPLNDLGNQRKICWDALGTEWTIIFANNWLTNSVGEEFVAILQILVTELGLSKIDLHLIRSKIEIQIEIADTWVPPVREPSNDIHTWVIKLPAVIEEDYAKIQMQPSAILVSLKMILDEISLLPTDSLYGEIDNMLEKGDLAGKTLPDFIYQRLYRYLISEESFDEPKRTYFETTDTPLKINCFDGLKWKNDLSEKYSLDLSMRLIKGRYKTALIPMHLTLSELKKNDRYPEFIKTLKEKGWLDWQIVLALFNHTISYKVSLEMSGKTFHPKETEQETVQKAFRRIMNIDEKDNYIPIPSEYYFDGDLDFQLKQVAILVTGNWDLDGQKSEFPNFNAVRDFLNKRFNFDKDDDISLSPL